MTSTATIRFYAELNDFLPAVERQRDVEVGFDVAPSVKDVIEGLGVPHTEIDLILVNGESVDLDHRLDDGDRVSVYPAFERLDVAALARSRPEPRRAIRFAIDVHLGTLARYLRLLGFDARLDAGWSDEALVDAAMAEERTVLTRDRGVLKRRAVTRGMFVRHDDPEEQLVEVVRRLHLAGRLRPFTRCMACNGLLEDVSKDDVTDRLEPRTRASFERFRRCARCGRVFWEGAHHRRLLDLVDRARAATDR